MRSLYLAIKFMPYWSLPISLIAGELGMIYRRRAQTMLMVGFFIFAFFFLFMSVMYFYFRWDKYAFDWLRSVLN